MLDSIFLEKFVECVLALASINICRYFYARNRDAEYAGAFLLWYITSYLTVSVIWNLQVFFQIYIYHNMAIISLGVMSVFLLSFSLVYKVPSELYCSFLLLCVGFFCVPEYLFVFFLVLAQMAVHTALATIFWHNYRSEQMLVMVREMTYIIRLIHSYLNGLFQAYEALKTKYFTRLEDARTFVFRMTQSICVICAVTLNIPHVSVFMNITMGFWMILSVYEHKKVVGLTKKIMQPLLFGLFVFAPSVNQAIGIGLVWYIQLFTFTLSNHTLFTNHYKAIFKRGLRKTTFCIGTINSGVRNIFKYVILRIKLLLDKLLQKGNEKVYWIGVSALHNNQEGQWEDSRKKKFDHSYDRLVPLWRYVERHQPQSAQYTINSADYEFQPSYHLQRREEYPLRFDVEGEGIQDRVQETLINRIHKTMCVFGFLRHNLRLTLDSDLREGEQEKEQESDDRVRDLWNTLRIELPFMLPKCSINDISEQNRAQFIADLSNEGIEQDAFMTCVNPSSKEQREHGDREVPDGLLKYKVEMIRNSLDRRKDWDEIEALSEGGATKLKEILIELVSNRLTFHSLSYLEALRVCGQLLDYIDAVVIDFCKERGDLQSLLQEETQDSKSVFDFLKPCFEKESNNNNTRKIEDLNTVLSPIFGKIMSASVTRCGHRIYREIMDFIKLLSTTEAVQKDCVIVDKNPISCRVEEVLRIHRANYLEEYLRKYQASFPQMPYLDTQPTHANNYTKLIGGYLFGATNREEETDRYVVGPALANHIKKNMDMPSVQQEYADRFSIDDLALELSLSFLGEKGRSGQDLENYFRAVFGANYNRIVSGDDQSEQPVFPRYRYQGAAQFYYDNQKRDTAALTNGVLTIKKHAPTLSKLNLALWVSNHEVLQEEISRFSEQINPLLTQNRAILIDHVWLYDENEEYQKKCIETYKQQTQHSFNGNFQEKLCLAKWVVTNAETTCCQELSALRARKISPLSQEANVCYSNLQSDEEHARYWIIIKLNKLFEAKVNLSFNREMAKQQIDQEQLGDDQFDLRRLFIEGPKGERVCSWHDLFKSYSNHDAHADSKKAAGMALKLILALEGVIQLKSGTVKKCYKIISNIKDLLGLSLRSISKKIVGIICDAFSLLVHIYTAPVFVSARLCYQIFTGVKRHCYDYAYSFATVLKKKAKHVCDVSIFPIFNKYSKMLNPSITHGSVPARFFKVLSQARKTGALFPQVLNVLFRRASKERNSAGMEV